MAVPASDPAPLQRFRLKGTGMHHEERMDQKTTAADRFKQSAIDQITRRRLGVLHVPDNGHRPQAEGRGFGHKQRQIG